MTYESKAKLHRSYALWDRQRSITFNKWQAAKGTAKSDKLQQAFNEASDKAHYFRAMVRGL